MDDVIPEEWRPVIGYAGLYEVSSLGSVRSLDRYVTCAGGSYRKSIKGQVLRQRWFGTPNHKRLVVGLSSSGAARISLVATLVIEAFTGSRPLGMDVCHNNGNPGDNRPENLRWDTRSANQLDSVAHGTHKESRKTACPQGHPYDAVNTAIRGRKRRCKACHRNREAARRQQPPGVLE